MTDYAQCPDCGNTELGKGKLSGYAVLVPIKKFFSTGSEIIVDVCTNCGTIIKMKVKQPEKFKDLKMPKIWLLGLTTNLRNHHY